MAHAQYDAVLLSATEMDGRSFATISPLDVNVHPIQIMMKNCLFPTGAVTPLP
jgi:hypothetical protein